MLLSAAASEGSSGAMRSHASSLNAWAASPKGYGQKIAAGISDGMLLVGI